MYNSGEVNSPVKYNIYFICTCSHSQKGCPDETTTILSHVIHYIVCIQFPRLEFQFEMQKYTAL